MKKLLITLALFAGIGGAAVLATSLAPDYEVAQDCLEYYNEVYLKNRRDNPKKARKELRKFQKERNCTCFTGPLLGDSMCTRKREMPEIETPTIEMPTNAQQSE